MNKNGEYEALLKELYNQILEHKKLTYDFLLEWIRKHKISPLTLYLLINDLKKEKRIITSEDTIIVDEDLKINIPEEISLKTQEKREERKELKLFAEKLPIRKKERIKKPRKIKRKTQKKRLEREKPPAATKSLLTFFEEPKKKETEEKKTKEISKRPPKKENIKQEAYEIDLNSLPDENIRKALKYLLNYWSVGEIRFKEDLKGMKIENPEEVLEKLSSMGFIERTRLGVINLKKEYRKKPKVYLSDLL